MNVVVCMKQVPESVTISGVPQGTASVRPQGKMVINPFDMYALEEGIRLKERYGGRVTAISMGPAEAEEALKEAIALGIGEAVLVCDPILEHSDTLATSYVLARCIERLERPDIVICGRQATDGDTGQVAPQLAEQLGLPFLSYVSRIEDISDGRLTAQRLVDEGHQVVQVSLPAVISVVKEVNEPRLPSLRGLMQAKKAEIPRWTAPDLGLDVSKVGLDGSPTRVVNVFVPQRSQQGQMLEGSPESQVDQLLEKLRDAKVI